MLMYIYLGITALILFLVIRNMLKDKKLMDQIDAAIVIIPLVLRLLLIK